MGIKKARSILRRSLAATRRCWSAALRPATREFRSAARRPPALARAWVARAWAVDGSGHPLRKWSGVARRALLVVLAVTVTQVLVLRWAPVPVSAFMLESVASARLRGDGDWTLDYRWVDWEEIPPSALLAVVAAEDQKFPTHHGFDFQAISEAWADGQNGERLRGGSTISQQVARNVFLWRGGGFFRKGLEAYYTVLIETLWPKRRVLEVYLNVAEFGDGVYGVEAASQCFFGKNTGQLTDYESALLASVLPSPRRLHAARPSAHVVGRTLAILDLMGKLGPSYLASLST
jgi:monofunctional biosynthetic peptidoglycan transglycosylase